MKRIVVVRAGALGDVILTFPALSHLRRRFPDAHITAVGSPQLWEPAGGIVDAVVSIDDPHAASMLSETKEANLGNWLRETDLVIAWTTHDPRGALSRAGVSQVLHTSPYPPPGIHAAEWLVESLSVLESSVGQARRPVDDRGASSREAFRAGSVSNGPRAEALAYGYEGAAVEREMPIFIHPGAGARWKRWPAERFAALADRLRREGYPVVLIEGPADEDAIRAVQQSASHPFSVIRGLSPAALSGELRKGRLFVGNDSGVTHLAAWNGLSTVALFGPTDPTSWAPRGDVHVLRACAIRAAQQGQIRVCDDPECMKALTLEVVLDAALEAAGNTRSKGTAT